MKTKYFTKIWGTILVSSSLLINSCEDFLDLKPTSSIVGENAISDARTARAAVTGIYAQFKSLYSSSNSINALAQLPGDNVRFGGTQTQSVQLDNNAIPSDNLSIITVYQNLYSLINRANWVIADIGKVTDVSLTQDEKDKLSGEAYFGRGYAYFELARGWGDAQIQTTPTTDLSTIKGITRSPRAAVYAQAIADLEEAEKRLPEDNITRNRAQKSTARAIRAKVHLYAEQWELSEQYASLVIANNKYELAYPYKAFFTSPFSSKESVFELNYSSTDKNNHWSSWFPSSLSGSYEFIPTQQLIDLLSNPATAGGRSALIKTAGNYTYGVLYNTNSGATQGTDPEYIIRIADLYLIRAEAKARKASHDYAGAIADLNIIRERAELTPFPFSITDETTILRAIEDERRLEFAFEADRWYDLARTGRAVEALGVHKDYLLFPIPKYDIESDPDLGGRNNPGY
ncbi:membrane protein [Bacteroidia bacterium]|nr:membrane protein [Bacteroidia bacterium]